MSTYTPPSLAIQARDAYLEYNAEDQDTRYDDPPLIAALTDIYPKHLSFAYRASSTQQLVLVTVRGDNEDTALGVLILERHDNPDILDVVLTECLDDRDLDKGTASPDLHIAIDTTAGDTAYDPLFGYLHCWLMDVRVKPALREYFTKPTPALAHLVAPT